MEWKQLLLEERFQLPKTKKEDGRSQFQKDIDRITFSSAFRRLGRKTQVHPLNENDHIHTRLSHSLEVACVGRSLGTLVGNFLKENGELPSEFTPLNVGEIVQAACLAHDIGNPPFGHAGEEIIRKWFQEAFSSSGKLNAGSLPLTEAQQQDFVSFDGNAMAFRTVTYREYFTGRGGMRLTYATLGALLKYPWTVQYGGEKKKFSCFQSEFSALKKIAEKVGLKVIEIKEDETKSAAKYARHPLAFLVEAADDICYKILDLEDAVELKILPADFIKNKFEKLLKLDSDEKDFLNSKTSWRTKNAFLRGKTMEILISDIIDIFKRNYEKILKGELEQSLLDISSHDSIKELNSAYQAVVEDVYSSKRKTILEIGAFSTIGNILENLAEAAKEIANKNYDERSYKTKKIEELLSENIQYETKKADPNKAYYYLMTVLDYIAGMTDHYATLVNKQILGLGI